MAEPMLNSDSVAWIDRELAAVSALHPAFDPAVWDLAEAEQHQAAQIDEALDLSARLTALEASVDALTRTVALLMRAWTEE